MTIKKHFIPVILAFVVFSSCKKEFFTDVNNNPNAPSSVPPGTVLTTIEGALAYTQGGDLSRFSSLFTQQTFGVSRQSAAYYQYIMTSQDADNLWGNLYTTTMSNCKTLIDTCDAKGYVAYAGVGRILMAYTLQLTVDAYGKIPYSQAFKGIDNIQPAYDDDASVYGAISKIIDDGLAKLNSTSPGALIPGAEDIIYAGDHASWIKFGHAIKARLALHQSKNNATMAQKALDEIALSFTGISENAKYIFGTTETSANPWYQFNEQRGDISFSGSTLAADLIAKADPRYPVLIDSTNDPSGIGLATHYGGIDGVVEFITYDELQFMKAEALIRVSNDVAGAQAAYQSGISANMKKLGIDTTISNTYLTANGTLDVSGGAAAIAQIANEENIALYLNPEAWTLYRRTGSPTLSPVAGSSIPRRLLYPQTEYSYNASNTPASTLYTPKVFWDVP